MALIDIVDYNGVPTGEQVERGKAYGPSFLGIKPHSHLILHNPNGDLYIQTRGPSKAYLPSRQMIFAAGGNENAERQGDTITNGRKKINYKGIVINEAREEIGINLREKDLRRINNIPRVISFQGLGTVYLAVYSAVYDPKTHGGFKINKSEVEDLSLKPLSYIEEEGIFLALGEYGEELFKKVEEISEKIKKNRRAA